MKVKVSKNKKIFIATAIVLVVAIICVAVVPSLIAKDPKNHIYPAKESAVFNNADFDMCFGESTKFLFNSSDSTFAVFSADGKNVFFSHSKSAAESENACFISIRLRDKNGSSYLMNSSSNSAAFGSFRVVETTAESLSLEYDFFIDKEDSQRGIGNCSVYARIPVKLIFKNNKMTFTVDTSAVEVPKNFFLEKVSVLPGFFSFPSGVVNTKFLVPDGCGALIDVGTVTEKPIILNMNMYGEDVSFYDYDNGAVLPFFAVINNGFAVNAIIEDGDALSHITCKKYEKGGGYLYNTFTVTACGVINDKFIYGETYKGLLSQSYVISESDADYNTVAAQLRNSLTERNYLSTTLNGNFSDLPFFINVVGSSDGKNQLTTFEDAAEITALLKARGVRNIALRYSGYGNKGLATLPGNENKFSNALGNEDGFSLLCNEITEQGNTLYLDTNIIIENKSPKKNVAVYDETSKFVGVVPSQFGLTSISDTDSNIATAYTFISKHDIVGTCINDASNLLYTDLSGDNDRQTVMNNLKENISSLSTCGSLMLDYPAIYLAKQADTVYSTPISSSCENFAGVVTVPVLQIVLHGSVVYGGMPVNISNLSYEDSLLKCIEYGCVPSFLFIHSSDSAVSYSSYATQTAKLYSKAKQLLPVMEMRITSHEKVTDGVYKVTYDYTKVIYINYNPSLVEVNGVMISAKDFVVI